MSYFVGSLMRDGESAPLKIEAETFGDAAEVAIGRLFSLARQGGCCRLQLDGPGGRLSLAVDGFKQAKGASDALARPIAPKAKGRPGRPVR